MVVSAPVLSDLADTLVDLSTIQAPGADGTDDTRESGAAGGEPADWDAVRAAARARFAPLNHVKPPSAEGPGSIVTVAPQDDPEVKLQATVDPDGQLAVVASFIHPVDGSWEPLYEGPAVAYDGAHDERTRNRIVYITEAWERAEELHAETVLDARQAQVRALRERDHPADRIGEILEMEPRAVRETLDEIEARIEASHRTVAMLG